MALTYVIIVIIAYLKLVICMDLKKLIMYYKKHT